MVFIDNYTTQSKINAEALATKEGDVLIEAKKVVLSPDAFASGELMQELIYKLESLRSLL